MSNIVLNVLKRVLKLKPREREMRWTVLKEAMMYFINRQDKIRHLGATKLAKLLFFADFGFYAEHHRSITGTTYVKEKHGPFPKGDTFYLAIEQLEAEGALTWIRRPSGSRTPELYQPKRNANVAVFTPEELAMFDEVIQEHGSATSQGIKDASHCSPPYVLTDEMEGEIDYTLAYY
jgi:hypothetical protein